ncbi:hypothetical protein GCM10010302_61020 [Streptomyces polychromogenes]|uniref:Uncharacterized protein n=1 Tax=Streptomyces polychromogenes TaxID=67342 RepID=A0ABP3FFJ5_9ACTN
MATVTARAAMPSACGESPNRPVFPAGGPAVSTGADAPVVWVATKEMHSSL